MPKMVVLALWVFLAAAPACMIGAALAGGAPWAAGTPLAGYVPWFLAAMACTVAGLAVLWLLCLRAPAQQPTIDLLTGHTRLREGCGCEPVLELGSLHVGAAYRLGNEILAYFEQPRDSGCEPLALFLSWRAGSRRLALRQWRQLARWQSLGAALRLSAASGLPAFVVQDATTWLSLPELQVRGLAR